MENKILIIDDEEVVLDSCTLILEGSGYPIVTAANGARGLELLQEFGPDLVFVDLKMPGISGLADIASRLEAVPDIPVVRLAEGDIVRHPLVASMLTVL